jgi:putative ABC transport system ATP-binding protein
MSVVSNGTSRSRPSVANSEWAMSRRSVTDGLVMDEVALAGSPDAPVLVDRFTLRASPKTLTLLIGPTDDRMRSILACLAGTIRPSGGHVWVNGVEVSALVGDELNTYRREHVGVAQAGAHLLEHGSVIDNVALPLWSFGLSRLEIRRRVTEAIDTVRLSKLADQRASALSDGDRRRVLLARALVSEPMMMIVEDPCGGLSGRDFDEMVRALRRCVVKGSIVIATSADRRIDPLADQVVDLGGSATTVDAAAAAGSHRAGSSEAVRNTVRPGTLLFAEGSWDDQVYCVERGQVELISSDGHTEVVEAGGVFGEIGAVFGTPRGVTARARTEVEYRSYAANEFIRVYGLPELRRLISRSGASGALAPSITSPSSSDAAALRIDRDAEWPRARSRVRR